MGNWTRQFSLTRLIIYQGEYYPSAEADISYGNGVENNGRIFVDANGNYFTLDSNSNALEAMVEQKLPETVVLPDRENLFNDYITSSNDNTQVSNVPHRDYNTNLTENALRGGRYNAAWEKAHPNATAWRNAAEAIPFAVATAPFMLGTGEAMAGTAAGQGLTNGLGLVTNAASNSTWLPWADAAISSYFAAHGLQDVANGNVTPQTILDLAPLTQVGKPVYEAGKGLYDVAKDWRPFGYMRRNYPAKTAEETKFISELDWSPEDWLGRNRIKGKYDAEDVAALNSHIPEYHQIEKEAKANGTWLKMPDGSTWEGDPRSWVQLMSKDGQKLQKRTMYHGDDDFYISYGTDLTPEVLGNKLLWTSTNKHLPATYGANHYQLTIPNGVPNTTFDAEGRFWNNLSAPSSYKYHNTNDVSLDLLKDNNTVNINNVVDVGPDSRWRPGDKGMPNSLPGEKLYDYYDRVFKGDDIILGKDVPRKSLLGNNGNFDLSDKNIYKGLIPFALFNIIPKEK